MNKNLLLAKMLQLAGSPNTAIVFSHRLPIVADTADQPDAAGIPSAPACGFLVSPVAGENQRDLLVGLAQQIHHLITLGQRPR